MTLTPDDILPPRKTVVDIANWLLARVSRFALVDIENIEFVCERCENHDVDCSVVGHADGAMVVYVRTCQACE